MMLPQGGVLELTQHHDSGDALRPSDPCVIPYMRTAKRIHM